MHPTTTAYGTWSGGRYMHFGVPLDEDEYIGAIHHAYDRGIRTFMTSDVYGGGEADSMLGKALDGYPRDSYCLAGTIGHDFYKGERAGSKGFPRFTDPDLRGPGEYADFLKMAAEKSLERCRTDHFNLVLLHNPDAIGYSNESVWEGMQQLKEIGLTELLGVAPGPANGFTLDVISCFEKFGPLIDWAMIILNPAEPWPGRLCLPAAEKHDVRIIARVVDHGGIFHDDVRPGHIFGERDHRSYRPDGWVEAGCEKLEQMRPYAEKHGLSPLELACQWDLAQPNVRTVIPTFIQESTENAYAKPILQKIEEFSGLPEEICLTEDECNAIAAIGNNKGCMTLKGGTPAFDGDGYVPDAWPVTPELQKVGRRWGIHPDQDLVALHR